MTIRNVDKGVFVTGGDNVSVSDVAISNIGEEAIHLKANTVDSAVVANDISNTGRLNPGYGEGVYIGSDPSVWCDTTDCDPDRSDRNQILDNTITGTTAEGIEAKAGTSDGIIEGNVIDGTRMTADTSGGWVVIKGNGYLVDYNRGLTAVENGFTATYSKAPGWGGATSSCTTWPTCEPHRLRRLAAEEHRQRRRLLQQHRRRRPGDQPALPALTGARPGPGPGPGPEGMGMRR